MMKLIFVMFIASVAYCTASVYELKGSTFCQGKADGNYEDLTKCNGFLKCSGGRTFRNDCPGNLNFNKAINACDFGTCKINEVTTPTTTTTSTLPYKRWQRAKCVFQGGKVTGTLIIDEYTSVTEVHGLLKGLSAGKHMIDVHVYGDMEKNCANTGGYYDKAARLGHIDHLEGNQATQVDLRSVGPDAVSVRGENSVLGRSLVITTKIEGWGESLACCVIGKATTDIFGR